MYKNRQYESQQIVENTHIESEENSQSGSHGSNSHSEENSEDEEEVQHIKENLQSATHSPSIDKLNSQQVQVSPSADEESLSKGSSLNSATLTSIGSVSVVLYVRHDLFAKKKFILNESELDYSTTPNSICEQCLRVCKMKGLGEKTWWDNNKHMIKNK